MRRLKREAGFTLVELLIVVGMLGVVMGSIYSLYITHQRTAYTQEEVVEVQQNLRIAMDSLTRDIKMAGFLIPSGSNPIGAGGDGTGLVQPDSVASDIITLNAASAFGRYAWIGAAQTGVGTALSVGSVDDVYPFESGAADGDLVRIIRAQNNAEPTGGTVFRVTGKAESVAAPTLTLTYVSGNNAGGTVFTKGDVICRTSSGAPNPNTISYLLDQGGLCPEGQLCLSRRTNAGTAAQNTQIIASNIAGLQFAYLLKDGTEPAGVPVNLNQVRAVRITLTGRTAATVALSGTASSRQLTSVVNLRNYR